VPGDPGAVGRDRRGPIYDTYLALNQLPVPSHQGVGGVFNAFFWTDERATIP
jgi:hypothetical protein